MNAGPKTACGGKRPSTGVFAQPLAGDPRAILRAAENESFSPEKHVISTRAEYKIGSKWWSFVVIRHPALVALQDSWRRFGWAVRKLWMRRNVLTVWQLRRLQDRGWGDCLLERDH